ncbi:tRNA-dihydrouridine(16/17) synthase [NAD(P)(+)]-like isoform X1 [Onychostruthus taczanowskii]|uniref:tRNA-dihydrouridine(16/17) synthase [NAD(P)(+)]-like isoform X1 n=1 Tax=Onychostruthus taczanowskii TaxID=356909 RepID=UPI001B80C38E|nr:tRNA-dihydrouridine(16/17) synthase [NAD(P)(+)]-like isoform X1 [Onychostruthus taczanowskii]
MPKLRGEAFWRETLRSAHYVVAPMVDQSELAWRLLSRRHGAQLCYTPMLHAQVFLRDANYRRENLYDEACPEDRPLIVQFCANDPEVFVQAALLAQDYCDAIDLNLGCPQMIAKRGHYGAFLQEEWDLLQRMILLANEKLSVPITCKIRVFPDIDKTVKYAQMLEKAGCQTEQTGCRQILCVCSPRLQLLTVHGRTKEQKGPLAGVASWEHIQAVRKAVNIPVFANGNIQCLSDVEECIRKTGVHGVMSAEGNLHNPALFEGRNPLVWEMAEEYLEIVRKYPCPLSYVRAHLFKLWHHTLQVYHQLREELAKVKTLEGIVDVNRELKLRCQVPRWAPISQNSTACTWWECTKKTDCNSMLQEEIANQKEGEKPKEGLPFFHWICQPYIRPGPKERCRENGDSGTEKGVRGKRALEEEEDGNSELLSKNKQKKKLRNPNKSFDPSLKPKYAKCDQCGNPKGTKCVFNMCRGCCKKRAFKEVADCPGHGLLFKTKYEKSLSWQHSQRGTQTPEISQGGDAEVGETAVLKEAGDSTG